MGSTASQNHDHGSSPDPLVMAYHEAGHVVAFRRVGHEIEFVSIEIVGNIVVGAHCSKGTRPASLLEKCFEEGCVDQGDEQELVEALVPLWAGPAAQKKFRPESVHRDHGNDDLQKIRRCVDVLCFCFGYPPRRKWNTVSRIKRRAAALMDDPAIWAQVEAVATALAEQKELSGAQVEAILRAAGPDPE